MSAGRSDAENAAEGAEGRAFVDQIKFAFKRDAHDARRHHAMRYGVASKKQLACIAVAKENVSVVTLHRMRHVGRFQRRDVVVGQMQ